MAYNKTFLNTENRKFTFLSTSEDEVLKLLKDANPEKAAGIESLSGRFLKDGAVFLALPISKLYNLLMKRSKFPLDWKIVKLKPLQKKGSKTDPKNYRPVSLLLLVSKVQEKAVHNQTENFLNKNKILYKIIFSEFLFNIINWQNKQRFWIWEVQGFNIDFWHNRSWNTSLKTRWFGLSEKVISRF